MIRSGKELPDKLYFKIGEVAKLVGVKPYVLRYWETEFPFLRPGKTRSQHRLYKKRDVETLLEIKRLLHNERYTIEGAKRRLKNGSAAPADAEAQLDLPAGGAPQVREALRHVVRELEEIRDLLTR
jgi:DNA-binding transcriptional MerR regulator